MENEAQYDLDRKDAKIFALYPNILDKYEHRTDDDLGLKRSTAEQARFEYFPLGKIFNKGLDKNDQKEGLFKRLKNIENAKKIQQQQNNNKNTKSPNVFNSLKSLSEEAKELTDEIEDANDNIDDGKLLFICSNKERFNFNTFNKPSNFISAIYNGEISLKEAEFKLKNIEKKKKRDKT